MKNFILDLAALIRNPRKWWHNATYARCSNCGQEYQISRWHEHRLTHDPKPNFVPNNPEGTIPPDLYAGTKEESNGESS